ncbi:hypothetical protein [Hahella sp. HN01]|uniref:hypothetical protein n=1 Tax=Hahella sp. HN01 TaxID=2847262 RepID=UPI001C1EEC7E|nr:hypothetical protein [Hahella sp. HN01]MBU6956028.1 hypothetical protein [Hahella sp. HN01]
MSKREDYKFYLDVINGNHSNLSYLFTDEPDEIREGIILNHAFDELVELGDKRVVDDLLEYVDEDIHSFNARKCGALYVLGFLGDSRHKCLIQCYIDSDDYNLSYIALGSMCELLLREQLSETVANALVTDLVERLSSGSGSVEKAVECARTLNFIGYQGLDELLNKAASEFPSFWDDYQSAIAG